MATRQLTPSFDHLSSDNMRQRVCKACDRCRLKKSKCDGVRPCSRCRAGNAICVFGVRKKARDKVYPKGYVEMLEQQQAWLVHGLQEFYRRTTEGEGWPGNRLKPEPSGHPLTHDLLTRLGVLDFPKGETFEENPGTMEHELCHDGLQCHESFAGFAESPHRPDASLRCSDAFSQQTMPPTPPPCGPSPWMGNEQLTMIAAPNPQPQYELSLQSFVNPLAAQGSPQRLAGNNRFNPFDELDPMTKADYASLNFDDVIPSPMFNRPIPMNWVQSSNYDFNHFRNLNSTEMTSI